MMGPLVIRAGRQAGLALLLASPAAFGSRVDRPDPLQVRARVVVPAPVVKQPSARPAPPLTKPLKGQTEPTRVPDASRVGRGGVLL